MTMTGSATTSVVYEPDGLQVRFPVPFPVFHADDVHAVSVDGTRQAELTNYTIEGIGTGKGVHITFSTPPDFGPKLVLYRWTKRVQESDYPEGGRFPAKVVETDFDRLVAMAQEIDEQFEWTLKIPRGSAVTPAEYTDALFLSSEAAKAASVEAFFSARKSAEAALRAREMAVDATGQAETAARMAKSAAQSAQKAAQMENQNMPDGTETEKGIVRLATAKEHDEAAESLAATPKHVLNMIVAHKPGIASTKTAGLARADGSTILVDGKGVLSVRPGLSFRPGMSVFMPGDKLYPNCAWPVGQLVLFAEWPELHAEYTAGYIKALAAGSTAAVIAAYPGLFVAHASGLYLPSLGGLFPRHWVPNQARDVDRALGSMQTDAMQQITGAFRTGSHKTDAAGDYATGAFFISENGASVHAYTGGINALQYRDFTFDSARLTRTASETRGINTAQAIAIYLGRHISEVQ